MEATVNELEDWLAGNAPALLGVLNPPASDADIASFEARASLVLPPEARRLYAIHDGEADSSDGIFGCRRWLPLSEVAAELAEIELPGTLPLFRSGGGDLFYVKSYDPVAPDRRLYECWHEVPGDARVVAESLEGFVSKFVADLDAGRYIYRPDDLAAPIDRSELPDE